MIFTVHGGEGGGFKWYPNSGNPVLVFTKGGGFTRGVPVQAARREWVKKASLGRSELLLVTLLH